MIYSSCTIFIKILEIFQMKLVCYINTGTLKITRKTSNVQSDFNPSKHNPTINYIKRETVDYFKKDLQTNKEL